MSKIKVYQSEGGLGYGELAFLIRLGRSKNGYDYLCIRTQNIDEDDSEYKVGHLVKDLEDIYVSEVDYKIEDSPLYGSFLFDHYINSLVVLPGVKSIIEDFLLWANIKDGSSSQSLRDKALDILKLLS